MHFIGTYFQTVDAKGRVALPARFRRLLPPEDNDTLVMTAGQENCFLLYPRSEWKSVMRILEELPRGEARRQAIRSISDHTVELDLDSNGRMTIAKGFLQRLQVKREVAFVGGLGYIEIWAREPYESDVPRRREESSKILDQIF